MHVPASCWKRHVGSACRYLSKTVNWFLMVSLFTIIPALCVLGSSWADWRRIFAQTKPNGSVEYLICLPAHGAVIGGWFGAWPMPLDWERQWQLPPLLHLQSG